MYSTSYVFSFFWLFVNNSICNLALQNDVRELKFNTTGQCLSPLVPTDNTQAFYEGVEGCGVRCQNPLLSEDEHSQIHQLVAWAGTICLLFNLFTVVSKCFEELSYDHGILSTSKYFFCLQFNGCNETSA